MWLESSWDLPWKVGHHPSPTHSRFFLIQKGKSASRAEGELIRGRIWFSHQKLHPCRAGWERGWENAAQAVPMGFGWYCRAPAALLQGALCRAARLGSSCARGQRVPAWPEPLGWLSALWRQQEYPATGRASERAHSSSLPVRQGAPGAD